MATSGLPEVALYWTISSIPELGHLSGRERRAFVRKVIPFVTRLRLVARPIILGFAAGLLTVLILRIFWRPGFGPYLTWCTIALVAVVIHLLQVRQIRLDIRRHIQKAFAGQRSPICLTCGFDLRGTERGVCPECGAGIEVPEEG